MNNLKPEDTFRNLMTSLRRLSLQDFLTKIESRNCFNRICKFIDKQGYDIESVGHFEWEFTKKTNKKLKDI